LAKALSVFCFRFFLLLGTIYSAYDNQLKEIVALKVEKPDKSKKVLLFEYETLKHLQGKQKYINKN